MLYNLFTYLREVFGLSGAGVFQFITFRASMAILLSLVITMIYGKKVIKFLQKKQIGETIRELGLDGQTLRKVRLQWADWSLLPVYWCRHFCLHR